MATNSEKPEEKKASTAKPVDVKAEKSPKTPRETAGKTTTAAKKAGTAVEKTASTAKKATTAAKNTAAARETVVEVKKTEPEKDENILKEAQKTLRSGNFDRGALILGGGLLLFGLLLLVGRLLNIPFGMFIWPFIFIIPGILIFLTALSTESSSGEGLSILGGILSTLGFVFLAQSVTGLWASWAYAWSLIAPTSIGVSQMVYGMRMDRDKIVQSGQRVAKTGLIIFTVGFVFFEVILGISGFGLKQFGIPVFPMMLVFAGVFILVISFLRNRK